MKPEPIAVVLVPGLNCSARIFTEQIPPLWRAGPVTVADHRRDKTIDAIARRLLAAAPPRFALVGFSFGGYIAFEILRQAPQRVLRLALLDTSARPDAPVQTALRRRVIAEVEAGRFSAVIEQQFPVLVHETRRSEAQLYRSYRRMAEECGPETYVRQQRAIIDRPDSRADLANIRCPTLVLVGDSDQITPPDAAREMAQGIAGARLVIVPDCGHLATFERPQAVTDALVAWIGGDQHQGG